MVDSVFLLIPSLLLLVVGISLLTRGRCQQGDGRPRRSLRRRQRQPPVLKPGGKRRYRAISLDDMVHESILRPHGGLPYKGGQLSRPFSFSMAPPDVHCMAKVAAGQAAGQVAMPRKDDRGISGREDKLLSSINTSESVEKTRGLPRKNEQPQGLTDLKLSITELKCHGAGNRPEELCSNMSSSIKPPQMDCIVRESILRPDGGLPDRNGLLLEPPVLPRAEPALSSPENTIRKSFFQKHEGQARREKEFPQPHGLSMASSAVPGRAKVAVGPSAGTPTVVRNADHGMIVKKHKLESSTDTDRSMGNPSGCSIQKQCPHGLRHPKIPKMDILDSKEGKRNQDPHSGVSPSSQPPERDCIVRESILHPGGRLPDGNGLILRPPVLPRAEPALSSPENTIRKSFFQKDEGEASREKEFPQPHGLSMASSAVPGMAKVAAGPTAGAPTVVRNADHGMIVKKHKLESSTDTDRSMGNPSGCSIQKQCPKGLRPRKISKMEILDSKERKRNQEPHSGVSPSSQPPERDCIVRESILHPDGRLPQTNGEFLQAMPPLAFPSLANREKGLSLPQTKRRDGRSAPDRDTDSALSHKECARKLCGLPKEQQQPRTGIQGSTGRNSSDPSPREIIVHERLLEPQDGRRQCEEVSMRQHPQDDQLPLKLSTAVPVLPSPANTIMYKDQGCQTDYVIILDPFVNDIRNGKEVPTAAPLRNKKLQLKEELRSKLREHITKKCREVQLQRFPGPVQRSMEMKRRALPKNARAGAGTLPPQRPSVCFSKPKTLVHPDQIKQKKSGASIACPEASRTPCSQPVPVYFHSPEATFMPEEQREALEMHIRGKKLQMLERRLHMKRPSQSAVPQEEGGRAALRTSALPSTPYKPTKKSSTSRNHGSQQPDSAVAVHKGKWQNLRKLCSALQGKAHGQKCQERKGVTGHQGPGSSLLRSK